MSDAQGAGGQGVTLTITRVEKAADFGPLTKVVGTGGSAATLTGFTVWYPCFTCGQLVVRK